MISVLVRCLVPKSSLLRIHSALQEGAAGINSPLDSLKYATVALAMTSHNLKGNSASFSISKLRPPSSSS